MDEREEEERRAEVEKSVETNKNWHNYLEGIKSGLRASTSSAIGRHQESAECSLIQFVCRPGTLVVVKGDDSGVRLGRIVSTLHDHVNVMYIDRNFEDEDKIWLKIEKLHHSKHIISNTLKMFNVPDHLRKKVYNFPNAENYKNDMQKKMHELVVPGQYFEVQDHMNPSIVYIAEVITNDFGLLKVKIGEKFKNIHMFDPFCHAVGWARSQDPSKDRNHQLVKYSNITMYQPFDEIRSKSVPDVVFVNNVLEHHGLQIGSILAVADKHLTVYYYAHVTRLINPHFFEVQVGNGMEMADRLSICPYNLRSPNIFPIEYLESCRINVELPPAVVERRGYTWMDYQKDFTCSQAGLVTDCGLVVDKKLEWKNGGKSHRLATMRFIEFIVLGNDLQDTTFFAAEIVGAEKSVIFVRMHQKNAVRIMHVRDNRLFHCGTAAKMKIPILFEDDENAMPEVRLKAKLSKRPRIMGYGENGKSGYLPHYLEKDYIIPPLYMNYECYVGRYLNKVDVNALQPVFQESDYLGMFKLLFKSLLSCVPVGLRSQVGYLLAKTTEDESSMPVLQLKYRKKFEPISRATVAICGAAKEMPAFLKTFLRCIDACPGLVSFYKNDGGKCPYGCHERKQMHSQEYLQQVEKFKRLTKKTDEEMRIEEQVINAEETRNEIEEDGSEDERKLEDEVENEEEDEMAVLEREEEINVGEEEEEEQRDEKEKEKTPVEQQAEEQQEKIEKVVEQVANDKPSGVEEIFGGHRRSLEKRMESAANTSHLLAPLPPALPPPPQQQQQQPFAIPLPTNMGPRNPWNPAARDLRTFSGYRDVRYPPIAPGPAVINAQVFTRGGVGITPRFNNMRGNTGMAGEWLRQPTWDQQMDQIELRERQRQMEMQQQMQPFIPPHRRDHPPRNMSPTSLQRFLEQAAMQRRESATLASSCLPSTSTAPQPMEMMPAGNFGGAPPYAGKILIRRPTWEVVKSWDSYMLQEYLRKFHWSLGVDTIQCLKDKHITGEMLLRMSAKDCHLLMPHRKSAELLHQLTEWIKEQT